MTELVPILDKLVNAGIIFVAVIIVLFLIVFGIALAVIMKVFHSIREEENSFKNRRM